jgi:hypothetical protein
MASKTGGLRQRRRRSEASGSLPFASNFPGGMRASSNAWMGGRSIRGESRRTRGKRQKTTTAVPQLVMEQEGIDCPPALRWSAAGGRYIVPLKPSSLLRCRYRLRRRRRRRYRHLDAAVNKEFDNRSHSPRASYPLSRIHPSRKVRATDIGPQQHPTDERGGAQSAVGIRYGCCRTGGGRLGTGLCWRAWLPRQHGASDVLCTAVSLAFLVPTRS